MEIVSSEEFKGYHTEIKIDYLQRLGEPCNYMSFVDRLFSRNPRLAASSSEPGNNADKTRQREEKRIAKARADYDTILETLDFACSDKNKEVIVLADNARKRLQDHYYKVSSKVRK